MTFLEVQTESARSSAQLKKNAEQNRSAAACNARSLNKFQTRTFAGIENAPKGFIRVENTTGSLESGRRVKVTIYHALFCSERKACTTNEQATRWIEKRRAVWAKTTGKINAVCSMRCTAKAAVTRISDTLSRTQSVLSEEQLAAVGRALAVLKEMEDSLR